VHPDVAIRPSRSCSGRCHLLHVADQLALSLDASPPGTHRQRGASSFQRLFRAHFPQLVARYEAEFAKRLGTFRLTRLGKAVERFPACGDYRRASPGFGAPIPDAGQSASVPSVAAHPTPWSGHRTDSALPAPRSAPC
jgi:hypothetical protein